MGHYSKSLFSRKKDVPVIPINDMVKIKTMARSLPQMAMKVEGERVARVGDKFVPAQSNMVDHESNLMELYRAAGISACEEYFSTIMKRLEATVTAADKVRIAGMAWYWRLWYWVLKVTGPWNI